MTQSSILKDYMMTLREGRINENKRKTDRE